MTFELASLRLATAYDAPARPLPVPGAVERGHDPALTLLDGASRGAHRTARLRRQEALLGVQLATPVTGALRVTVVLLLDDHATRLWRLAQDLESPDDPLPGPRTDPGHRWVQVEVQGRPRAVALLHRRPGEHTAVQRVVLDVAPEEVGPGGLLLLGFRPPPHLPPWALRGLLPDSLSGVCVARVRVEPASRGVAAGVSTGRAPDAGRHLVPPVPGGFAVSPGGTGHATEDPATVRLRITPRALAPRPAPAGRRARVREPLARARDAVELARLRRAGAVRAEVTPVGTGRTTTARPTPSPDGPDGSLVLEVPADDGPLVVRLVQGTPTPDLPLPGGRAPAWHVGVLPGSG